MVDVVMSYNLRLPHPSDPTSWRTAAETSRGSIRAAYSAALSHAHGRQSAPEPVPKIVTEMFIAMYHFICITGARPRCLAVDFSLV